MRRVYVLLTLMLAACSSSTTAPSPTVTAASTFTMTWPTLAFPSTAVGATAAPIAITLTNNADTGVAVASVTDSNAAEFPYTSSCNIGGTLPAHSQCQVTTKFTPAATGARTATLTVSANGATQTFSFTGTGVTAVTPHLAIDLTSGPPGTIFTLSVTGATPASTVTLNTIYTAPGSSGALTTTPGWATDSSGNATIASNSDDRGTYESWVVDATTGTSSNHVTHTVQ